MQSELDPLTISERIALPLSEITLVAIRASGPGGQNVNKVSSAIQLRFDILQSSLPDFYKQRLMKLRDNRINAQGVLVIKAQRYRDQERNREDALLRLQALIRGVAAIRKQRVATKPSRAARQRRLDGKRKQSERKSLRRKPTE